MKYLISDYKPLPFLPIFLIQKPTITSHSHKPSFLKFFFGEGTELARSAKHLAFVLGIYILDDVKSVSKISSQSLISHYVKLLNSLSDIVCGNYHTKHNPLQNASFEALDFKIFRESMPLAEHIRDWLCQLW